MCQKVSFFVRFNRKNHMNSTQIHLLLILSVNLLPIFQKKYPKSRAQNVAYNRFEKVASLPCPSENKLFQTVVLIVKPVIIETYKTETISVPYPLIRGVREVIFLKCSRIFGFYYNRKNSEKEMAYMDFLFYHYLSKC